MPEQFTAAIRQLWTNQFPEEADVYHPMVYGELVRNSLLFVGLNPSMPNRELPFLAQHLQGANYRDYFHWSNRDFCENAAFQIEQLTRLNYPFFNKFREIATQLVTGWEHIDLFSYRRTSQGEFLNLMYDDNRHRHLNAFGQNQLNLAAQLIHRARPRLVLVANKHAARIFETTFNAVWDEQRGHHTALIGKRTVPVFFSSMLTGRGALDIYSYQRLRWHIGRTWAGLAD